MSKKSKSKRALKPGAPVCQHVSMAGKRPIVAVDYFAGTGWGVAAKRLGIHELGVENMPEAVLTREANGMITAYLDVWDGMTHTLPFHDLFIASPPCQTFSMAGGGAGRKALDEVIAAIHRGDFLDLDKLRTLGELHDPRTALVLTPLWHISRYLPRLVALEQVPPVLPVWEAYAERMRAWGYSVWTGILNAEQYGVPQTRRRAVLMARWDGIHAAPPTPTHNKYNHRAPDKGRYADETLLPWVSMEDALGWGMTARPYLTISGGANDGTPGGHTGGQDPMMVGGSGARRTIREAAASEDWVEAPGAPFGAATEARARRTPQYGGATAEYEGRPGRKYNEPAFTVTGHDGHPRGGFEFVANNQDNAAVRQIDEPAPTIAAGHSTASRVWRTQERHRGAGMLERHGERKGRPISEPALTITGNASGTTPGGFRVVDHEAPATTVMGDPRIAPRGHHDSQMNNSTRVTATEAAALQSYPADFIWCGNKGKQFLQIGNAVPPLLAEAILAKLLDDE